MRILKGEKGFTLIELVLVIVVLGILAAAAIPRYISLQTQARTAAVNGLAGGVRAAASIVYAGAVVTTTTNLTDSCDGSDTLSMQGATVTLCYGYPDSATGGINNAVQDFTGFTFTTGAPSTFTKDAAPTPATCSITYTEPAAAGNGPTITQAIAGC